MSRLDVSATIHPLSVNYLLVSVEDEAGEPVKLNQENFSVQVWASTLYTPGAPQFPPIPVVDAMNVTSGEPHTFWQLELGDVQIADKEHVGTFPVSGYGPLVYVVSVDVDDDHGQAIACACCPPEAIDPDRRSLRARG